MARALALVTTIAAAALSGCIETGAAPENGPDARPVPDAAPPLPDAPPPPMCKPATANPLSGQHNPGLDCMAGNCHGPVGNAPKWSIAGTLYSTRGGGAVVPNATITVIDAAGKRLDLVSAQNGNFWTDVTVAFPVKVYASQCPALLPMNGGVQDGSCNACHTPAGLNGAGGRVYLQ